MMTAAHNKLAWCATFARLLAFETKGDIAAAMRIANPAYDRDGRLPPARAVQNWLHSALTWPGTDPFINAGEETGDDGADARHIARV